VLVDLATDEGITGRSYAFAYFPLALKPLDALMRGLGEMLVGRPLKPRAIEADLRARFTLLGGARNLAAIAIGAIDMAAWDALAVAHDLPLATMLGGAPRPIRAYDSRGMIRADDAASTAEEVLASGFQGVKVKIGWPTFAEDLAVVRAIRRHLGDDVALMVDYNQSLSVVEATKRCRALDDEGLGWIEEPVRCDDFRGCAEVARAVETPIQIGENIAGRFELKAAIDADACDLLMPDPQQIGGVTGWLDAAALAHAAGKPVSSHIFIEASSHLLAVTPTCNWLEYLDVAAGVVREPLAVRDGSITARDVPGTGLEWDGSAVTRCRAD
jgi:mandelate racemase